MNNPTIRNQSPLIGSANVLIVPRTASLVWRRTRIRRMVAVNLTRRTQAALAVLAVAIIGCSQASEGGTGGAGPNTTAASATSATTSVEPLATTTSQSAAASPVQIATAFVEAYAAFDVDKAASYLTDDALQEFAPSGGGGAGDAEGLRLQVRHLEAAGFKLLLDSCEEQDSSPSGTSVRCTYDYHRIRSDEIGLGPYSGSQFDITVLEGEIVSVSDHFVFLENGFSDQMWEPFAEWVAENYPEDGALMYENWPSMFMAQLTDESIELWEQRSIEYAATAQGEVAAAQPPVEFTGRITCGPPVSSDRAGNSETLDVGDEGLVLIRYRGGAWRQTVTMTDPRLEGTIYQTWESDTYAMQGAGEGAGVWAATHRIENEAGAWEGRDYGGNFSDGTAIGAESGRVTDDSFAAIYDSFWIGEGAYAGLIAIMEQTPFEAGCGVDVRGIIFEGAPVPQPYISR